jgi:hypothetical protein
VARRHAPDIADENSDEFIIREFGIGAIAVLLYVVAHRNVTVRGYIPDKYRILSKIWGVIPDKDKTLHFSSLFSLTYPDCELCAKPLETTLC